MAILGEVDREEVIAAMRDWWDSCSGDIVEAYGNGIISEPLLASMALDCIGPERPLAFVIKDLADAEDLDHIKSEFYSRIN